MVRILLRTYNITTANSPVSVKANKSQVRNKVVLQPIKILHVFDVYTIWEGRLLSSMF